VLHSNHQHLVSPESANGCTEMLTHERAEAARAFGVGGGLRSSHRQNALRVPVATPRIAHHRLSDQRPLCERVRHQPG